MLSPDTLVRVHNRTKRPESWGGFRVPPFGTAELPFRIAENLIEDARFNVDFGGHEEAFPLVDERGVNLTFSAPFHYVDGYGSCAGPLSLALERAGFYMHVRTQGYFSHAQLPERVLYLLGRNKDVQTRIGLNLTYPPAQDHGPGCVRYGMTMFETDRMPKPWVPAVNTLRRVFVPCRANAAAFRASGVTAPIHVANLGVAGDLWTVVDRREQRNNRSFTFLCAGTLTGRKNTQATIAAFTMAFPADEDVRLVFKTRQGALGHGPVMRYAKLIEREPRIRLIDCDYPPDEMVALFQQCDCFVFPSKGEGFGLPPLQAMATGMPVIIAGNSGLLEMSDERYNWTIRENVPVAADEYPADWADVGNWWEPSIEELVAHMRYVYEHQDEAYAKGMAAAEWVRWRFTWDRTAQVIIGAITEDYPDLPDLLREHPPQESDDSPGPFAGVTYPADVHVNVFMLAHGQLHSTLRALTTTFEVLKSIPARYWLLDNGSPPESGIADYFEALHKADPDHVRVFHSDKNLGVGEGRAVLLKSWLAEPSSGPHDCGLILDNDIEWNDKEGFRRMLAALYGPGVAAVGIEGWQIVGDDGSETAHPAIRNPFGQDVDIISGFCQLFHRSVAEAHGVPRGDLVWAEDWDFVLRPRSQGKRILAVAYAGLVHHDGVTTKTVRGENFLDRHDEDVSEVLRTYRAARAAWTGNQR